ncbi:hypothetical protein C8R43DRAFT_1131321 [Mycena crocata]|nr:hypothetical protein C8R43DRAFT_1131321 [Mycena crocata]
MASEQMDAAIAALLWISTLKGDRCIPEIAIDLLEMEACKPAKIANDAGVLKENWLIWPFSCGKDRGAFILEDGVVDPMALVLCMNPLQDTVSCNDTVFIKRKPDILFSLVIQGSSLWVRLKSHPSSLLPLGWNDGTTFRFYDEPILREKLPMPIDFEGTYKLLVDAGTLFILGHEVIQNLKGEPPICTDITVHKPQKFPERYKSTPGSTKPAIEVNYENMWENDWWKEEVTEYLNEE